MSSDVGDESDRAEGAPHPRHASVLIGQGDHETALLDAYRSGRLPHALVLGGQPGIGKATLAWRLAKFILDNPSSDASAVRQALDLSVPATSRTRSQVEHLSHPDLALLRRELNEKTKRFFTEIRADDVRRAIGLFQRAPGAGGYRICIVDNAEDLNRSSANALLKLIEEPPPRSLFVLVAHRPGLLLPTIRSRCRVLHMKPLAPDDIGRIVAGLGIPWANLSPSEIASAATQAQGSVRDALRLLGNRDVELSAGLTKMLDRLPALDWREVYRVADAVSARDAGPTYDAALSTIFDWLSRRVRRDPGVPPSRLARYAEVWEKLAQAARETDALNLDKRPLILSIFSDLAAAVRAASA